jgi:hypothetical protein
MRTLREEIGLNAGTKKRSSLLIEDYKAKEIEAMSRAYCAFSNFARDINCLKHCYDPSGVGYYGAVEKPMPEEARDALRKKLHDFCLGKLEYLKEVIDESLGEKEKEEEEPHIEISIAKEE